MSSSALDATVARRALTRLADRSAALEVEAAELDEAGRHADAHRARAELVVAGVAAGAALDELIAAEVDRMLATARAAC